MRSIVDDLITDNVWHDKAKACKKEILEEITAVSEMHSPQDAFDKLDMIFQGHNHDGSADENWQLFDFNYKEICSTIILENDKLRLCGDCEIWDDDISCLVEQGYEW